MAQSKLSFALGPSQQGVPLTGSAEQMILQAAGGGPAELFQIQNQVAEFTKWIKRAGQGAWQQLTRQGNPIYVASNGPMSMVLDSVPNTSVIEGKTPPSQFNWNGQNYNIVGSLTGTLSYNQQPLWVVEAPLALAEAVPVQILTQIAWSGLIQPLLEGFWNGVSSCFSGAVDATSLEDAAAVAADAAADAAVDDAIIEGVAVVSLEAGAAALVALAVLIAIPIVLSLLLHPSFQNLIVYNLTPYDIMWRLTYVDYGLMTMAPIVGQDATQFNAVIPAISTISPPGLKPVRVAHQASFSFASGSDWHGLGYIMTFFIGEVSAAALFCIPESSSNILGVFPDLDPDQSQELLYQGYTYSLQGEQTFMEKKLGPWGEVVMSVSYDYLTGKHPTPGGQNAYYYNSLVVFQTQQSVPSESEEN